MTQPAHPSISAVLVSCNEADVIEPCLQSVASWVNEIVVVDMHSSDGTREIAQRYNCRLIDHERLPDAGPARDFAFSQASCDWILMLDPDERVPESLARELLQIAPREDVDVVKIPREQILFGIAARSPGASDGMHPRFFRKGKVYWPGGVHAHPDLKGLRCLTLPERADCALLHDTWRSVPMVLDKIVRYSPRDVEDLQAAGIKFSVSRMLRAGIGEFMWRMFDGRAYEDGMAGLLAAFYFAVYKVTIYAVLWEAEGHPRQFDRQIQRWGRRLRWQGSLVFKAGHATRRR